MPLQYVRVGCHVIDPEISDQPIRQKTRLGYLHDLVDNENIKMQNANVLQKFQ